MAQKTKTPKGGWTALALIFSVLALIVSILAYSAASRPDGLDAQIEELQTTVETMKTESAEQLERLRRETAEVLEKMSETVKKDSDAPGEVGKSG